MAESIRKKVLLMGKSGSGKTSMRSIIFANYLVDVDQHKVRFLGNLLLNLWDCGGQDAFYENYFESQRDRIFRNVQLLIYVFDIESSDLEKDFRYYTGCIEAIAQNSKDAKVFCLIHKMDLVGEEVRDKVFDERAAMIREASMGLDVRCYGTSIWDETLYRAWSAIVYSLIPNIGRLQKHLDEFCRICDADEVVLFERATFLVISDSRRREHRDVHRFEKVSNIIKQFKLSCLKTQASFQGLKVKNSAFTAFVDYFTTTTYIMVITSDPTLPEEPTLINIAVARPHFEEFVRETSTDSKAGTSGGAGRAY